MIAFLRTLLYVLMAGIVVWFSVENSGTTPVTYSPFHAPADLPLYAVALGGLAAGFLLGCIMVWLNTLSLRFRNFRKNRTIRKLEKNIDSLAGKSGAGETLPALPPAETKARDI